MEEEDLTCQNRGYFGGGGGSTSAIEEDGRDSQGDTPMPVIILPIKSIAHDGAVAHQIHPTRKINCPRRYTEFSQLLRI